MTKEQFNSKYHNYIDRDHYGLEFDIPEVTEFLNELFSTLIKIPHFRIFQIKLKYGLSRVYLNPDNKYLQNIIEEKIDKLIATYDNNNKN